jgi:hypothetical protein
MRNEGAGFVLAVPRLTIDIRHVVGWLTREVCSQATPNGRGRAVKRAAMRFPRRTSGP